MGGRFEPRHGFAADPPGRAVRVGEIGVGVLERLQFLEPGVEVEIRHDRIGVDVVRPIRAVEQFAKRGDPVGIAGRISHG